MKYLLFSILTINLITSNAQETKIIESVIHKLSEDNKAFKNFLVLGKLNGIDNLTSTTDNYFQFFSLLYNSFDPFCRLFDMDSLANFYLKANIINLESIDLPLNRIYDEINSIERKWAFKKKTKKLYCEFIKNQKYFRKDLEVYELESQMRQYVKSNKIAIESK
ncbi:MAG: hypothetical protein WBP41_08350 [Saprospiraceae bacterium]